VVLVNPANSERATDGLAWPFGSAAAKARIRRLNASPLYSYSFTVSDADDQPKRAVRERGGLSPNPGGKRKPPSSEAPKPEITCRNKDGTFAKGFAPNAAGRPKGTRHHATRIAEALIDGQVELLVQKAIEMAMGGEPTVMRLLLDRLIAPRKERPVSFVMPQIKTASRRTPHATVARSGYR
jgi:hypothetical protein